MKMKMHNEYAQFWHFGLGDLFGDFWRCFTGLVLAGQRCLANVNPVFIFIVDVHVFYLAF